MTVKVSSYGLQYSNVNYPDIKASTFDLFITEGAPIPKVGSVPAISDAQVAELVAQGRTVVGYVDVAVTDTNRSYWNEAWTTKGGDLDPLTAEAPDWLKGQPTNAFGVFVDYTNADWQKIVIDQAVDLVRRGYSGVFLDDVAAYFAVGSANGGSEAQIRQAANAMAEFVIKISDAIHAANPDAYIVANTSSFITKDVTVDARGTAAAAGYLRAVDAQLLENPDTVAIMGADNNFADETVLILRSTDQTERPALFDNNGYWLHGVFYQTANYQQAGTFAYPATALGERLNGGNGPNAISGLGGNDILVGYGGNDRLSGNSGNDRLVGGLGNDVLTGGTGRDRLIGGAGRDTMTGSGGADAFVFGSGDSGSRAATADRITDFNSLEQDRIDLSGIDANQAVAGNQAFSFIGTAAFTAAGQVREFMLSGRHYIALERTGDTVADMVIRVDGVSAMQASDFVL